METGLKSSSFKTILLGLLHSFYKFFLNPLMRAVSPLECSCKFLPSCSVYAKDALQKHNWIVAARLIFVRLLKCNPFTGKGFVLDPVPFSESVYK